MEAFRRGSQADRVCAGVALLLGIFLLRDHCNFLLIPSHPSPRHMHPYLHGGLLNNAGEILWIVVNLPSITVMGWVYRIFYLGSPGLIGTLTAVTTVTQWLIYYAAALRFVAKRIN